MAQDKFMKFLKSFALFLGVAVVLLSFFEFMLWVNFLAVSGHDVIMAIITIISRGLRISLARLVDLHSALSAHFAYYGPLYGFLAIVFAVPTAVYLFYRSKWKAILRRREEALKNWQNQTEKERDKSKALSQRYVDLKKAVTEAARPCIGDVKFNNDDTISYKHLFCRGIMELKGTIAKLEGGMAEQRKRNLRLTQDLVYARRTGQTFTPTPEHTQAMKCDEIRVLKGRVERYEIEENLRKSELRDLKVLYEIATKDPEAKEANANVERLQKELKERNVQLDKSQQTIMDLQKECDDTDKDLKSYKATAESHYKSKLVLEKQVTIFKKSLLDKDFEIENLQKSVKANARSNEDAKTAQKEIADLQKRHSQDDQQLCDLRKTVDALKASQKTVVRAPTITTTQTHDSKAVIDELSRVKAENIELQTAVQNAKEQQKKHGEELAAEKAETKRWYEASKATMSADACGSQEHQNMAANAKKLGQERNDLEVKVRQLEADLVARPSSEDVEAAEAKHAKIIQDADEKHKELYNNACEALAIKDKELSAMTQQLAENSEQLNMAEKTFKDKEREITKLNQRVNGLVSYTDATECKAQLEAAQLDNQNKDQTILKQNQEIMDLTQRITAFAFSPDNSDCASQLEMTRKMVVGKDEEISVLQQTKAQYVNYSERLDAYITTLEGNIEELRQSMDAKDAIIKNRDNHITGLDKTIDSLTENMYDSEPESPLLDTGALAKNLKQDIEDLKERLALANAEIDEKDDILARKEQSIQAFKAAADVTGEQLERAQVMALETGAQIEDLEEIERLVELYNLEGISSHQELPQQIDTILSRAQDAQFTYARLIGAGLVHPQNGDRLDQHVLFVINEMQRHRAGAADFYNIAVAIENELDKKFGERPEGSRPGQHALGRVKRLVDGE